MLSSTREGPDRDPGALTASGGWSELLWCLFALVEDDHPADDRRLLAVEPYAGAYQQPGHQDPEPADG